MAEKAYHTICNEDVYGIGELLRQSWDFKKQISPTISNKYVDGVYAEGLNNGAIGGKLLGSGGSGFILFIVNKREKKTFSKEMGLPIVDFSISQEGSKIL